MSYEKTRIIVERTDPKKNPDLYERLPYCCRIRGGSIRFYTREELIHKIAEYMIYNPYNIVLKNKIPEEKKERAVRKTLDTLVMWHNRILELGSGGVYQCIKRAERFLKEMAKEK
jgi:hypothetical protein